MVNTDIDVGDDAKSLGDALAKNTVITNINLSHNDIGAEGAKSLADALAKNTVITNINLRGNHICAEGMKSLADALAKNTTITTIDFSYNDIGHDILREGMKSLADALAKNTTITIINLKRNGICAKRAKLLADALGKNTTITNINLSSNNISATGAKSLADALAKNTTITNINLSHNNIGVEGAKLLADTLASNTTITTIALPKKSFNDESWKALQKAGFSFIDLDTFLYDVIGSEISSDVSDVYFNMKIWGKTRNKTSGRLPLFTAAAKSLTWVDVRQILTVNMPVIYDVDGLTGLPVFMLAAVGPQSNIEAVYHLLKEYPSALCLMNNQHHNASLCTAINETQVNCIKNK